MRTKFTPNPQAAQQKQAEALTLLEQGIQNLATDQNWLQYLKVQSSFHQYSFNNVLMIVSQFPEATRVAGYRAWQAMNRQVKKGERGIVILAPMVFKTEDKQSGDTVTLTRFKTASVFDISQTEGEELPELCATLRGEDEGLLSALESYATSLSIPVERDSSLGEVNGVCRFLPDQRIKIEINPLRAQRHQAKTLAHELGHALMHTAEEYRTHSAKSQRELEAESVAFVVLSSFGLDSGDYSFAYIADWSGGSAEAITQLKESGRRIQQAAHQIIEGVDAQMHGEDALWVA